MDNSYQVQVNTSLDLSNCDQEPIHLPGAIQPFGFLLCLSEETMQVVMASENVYDYTGIPAGQLLQQGLDALMSAEQQDDIRKVFLNLAEGNKWLHIQLDRLASQRRFMVVFHRYDGLRWLEFEPEKEAGDQPLTLSFLNTIVRNLLKTSTLRECCQLLAESVRNITGFDRVVVYRFKEDESGQVIAEAKREALETWVDLHYPASDIPGQARVMYLKNWLRFIPDASYTPVKLLAAPNFPADRPPDMTYAMLRSVSRIHLEYLHNMGVAASMSITLIQDEKLWGLVACHHQTPRLLANDERNLCEFLGCTFSALLKEKESQQDQAYRLRIRDTQTRLLDQLRGQENFRQVLHQSVPTIREMLDCGGAAVCFEDEITTTGHTPTPEAIREITGWLRKQAPQDLFHTHCYRQHNPRGSWPAATCSGLLAASLSKVQGDYFLWFRPEVIQTVNWAGEPHKAVVVKEGTARLSPRNSFAAWKELVRDHSLPWKPLEVEAAGQLRSLLIDILLKVAGELKLRADILTRLNRELERSNSELDSFAYMASHDLKEPLRGIHNYSVFLLEDYAGKIDQEGEGKLQTLIRLSQRMESLIDSLLQFSRLGQLDLALVPTDLNRILTEVLDTLQLRLAQPGTTVRLLTALPTLRCDPIRVAEVFGNLITNALKYNDQPEKTVETGILSEQEAKKRIKDWTGNQPPHVFFVRDNGIGIEEKHRETIFKLFRQLHPQERYGGGTGAGLTIVKKIIDKHGGDIWLESVKGQGTTFYFTLQTKAQPVCLP